MPTIQYLSTNPKFPPLNILLVLYHQYIHLAFLKNALFIFTRMIQYKLCVFTQGHRVWALRRGVRAFIPQHFPVLTQYFGLNKCMFEKILCRYFVHSKYFGFSLHAADTTRSSISRFCTATEDTTLRIFLGLALIRDSLLLLLLWILLVVLRVSRGSVLRVLQVLAVFRPLVVFVLRALAVPKYSQYAQYTSTSTV